MSDEWAEAADSLRRIASALDGDEALRFRLQCSRCERWSVNRYRDANDMKEACFRAGWHVNDPVLCPICSIGQLEKKE